MPEEKIIPAKRHTDEPDPEGWSAADVLDEERVDDDFIAEHCARVYEPLAPEDEKLFPVEET
jgi:hypothetical protein